MNSGLNTCIFCGEFVLQVPGWTSSVPAYRRMRATWRDGNPFLEGGLHFSCLRESGAQRMFSDEFTAIATGHDREVNIQVGGENHSVVQPGLGYTQSIYQGSECEIYRNDSMDSWMVLERSGPWSLLDPSHLHALGKGEPLRLEGGAERVVLPKQPETDLATVTLPELLESFGVGARYPQVESVGAAEFELWGYHERKRVLEYSVNVTLPLPSEAAEFLQGYSRTYRPIDYDQLEREQ